MCCPAHAILCVLCVSSGVFGLRLMQAEGHAERSLNGGDQRQVLFEALSFHVALSGGGGLGFAMVNTGGSSLQL